MQGSGTQYDNVHDAPKYQQPVPPPRQDSSRSDYRAQFVNPVPLNQAPVPHPAYPIPAMIPRSPPQDKPEDISNEQMEEFWRLMEQRVDESMWNKKRFLRLWNDVCAKTNDELNPELQYRGVFKRERKTNRGFEKAPKLRLNRVKVEAKPPVPPRRDSMI